MCRVEVKLNTPSMGLIRCDLQVARRNLTVQFVTQDERSRDIINQLQGLLARRLEDMDFAVMMLDTKVDREDADRLRTDDSDDVSGIFQINLTV